VINEWITVDANEAAAMIAHRTNEVIAIYPITPASPMGEHADEWSAAGRTNIFGTVPRVIEMQSEGGAAGAVHGSLQAGALTTTFTASQGLLLMIPNMFKIAGELTSTVFHVAARTVATHALSIFGDHSDVMAARSTGWAMLCASNVQEAHDFALIAQNATLQSRIPFLHFFDGFRTSHEMAKIVSIPEDVIRTMISAETVESHRNRSLSPDRPVLRGSAQNPDVFFQAREASNPFYAAVPGIVIKAMNQFASATGRTYQLFDYVGRADAERVIVLMGSGADAAQEAVESLVARGERVGLLKVRLYRPFAADAFIASLPPTVRALAVLDRTKEPGAVGEPLYQEVVTALSETWTPGSETGSGSRGPIPKVIGGRYGLASKEFTPAMVMAVFRELAKGEDQKRHFTIGIVDDVTHLSLHWEPSDHAEPSTVSRAVFYGLGSDGTVGATKNTVKIIGGGTDLFAQGYFVYDSKKSGSVTVSHLRFSREPIRSTYLIEQANFVACHQFTLLDRMDVLSIAEPGAIFLLNSPFGPDAVWERLPGKVQQQIIEKRLRFFVVDGYKVAKEAELGQRVNTVLQTCFFALTNVLPREQAIAAIKKAVESTFAKRGETILMRNFAAIDGALKELHEVEVPRSVTASQQPSVIAQVSNDFVERVTSIIMAGNGDRLPVSAFPPDGTFPTGTACFEKRSIAAEIPIWDPDICIECGLCALVCPHAAIRTKVFESSSLTGAPEKFRSIAWTGKDFAGYQMAIQVAPDDCTGCGVCVDVCPARSKEVAKHKAIDMMPKEEHLSRERASFDFFLCIPEIDRTKPAVDTVKGCQLLQPLFEFSGACAGCGETPYLKLLTQLFGDRVVIANATGCSSIYGGNLPTTPWSKNADGRGPAWSNSLFEDNAEFGLGMRLAIEQQFGYARHLLKCLAGELGDNLVRGLLDAPQTNEAEIAEQRKCVIALKTALARMQTPDARTLLSIADAMVEKSVWIIGGDGWAYDIGFGGLDHVLASGCNVNILVLDTEVYSNTGGQASKSTPRGAVAKFAADGRSTRKKDLGMLAVDYGNVYVAQIAVGAQPLQTVRAFHEAQSYTGTSLIIAYSHCIAHGIDMSTSMTHQKDAVNSAYWPLFRYDPRLAVEGGHPFHLDSHKPTVPFQKFAGTEARYAMLGRSNPKRAQQLMSIAQKDIDARWRFYEQMAGIERAVSD